MRSHFERTVVRALSLFLNCFDANYKSEVLEEK
jgi:hypothetical protein